MDKDLLMTIGTITAFVAAILSVMEKLLDLQSRVATAKSRKAPIQVDSVPEAPPPADDEPGAKTVCLSSYLLVQELAVILASGLLLNYLGLMLSLRLHSILYLDMTGTALAALLLGPWWGAIVALLSNSLVNWLLYPETGADVFIFPWALVNMTGGFFWGLIARRTWFRTYLRSPRVSIWSHLWYLLVFGLLGACVMSVPGALVEAALSARAAFVLNPDVSGALEQVIAGWQTALQGQLEALLGLSWGGGLSIVLLDWLANALRYIPDKTMSAAIALVVLKYGFPLFERELIHGGPGKEPPRELWVTPLLLGCFYIPCFLTLLLVQDYRSDRFWALWSAPLVLVAAGFVLLRLHGPSDSGAQEACARRHERYRRALKPLQKQPVYGFCRSLTFVTLVVSAGFALFLPFLLRDFQRTAFNFFCVVYGFLLAVHLVRVAISQNLSMVRTGH